MVKHPLKRDFKLHTTQEVRKFTDCPFSDVLQKNLAAAGYESPTPIQAKAIMPALEGKDLIGLAQTGTGKTAVFVLPIVQRLAQSMDLGALVLAPTRELVHQIVGVFQALGRYTGIRVAGIVGGVKIENDWKALKSWPNVIVATPGRLLDHMEQRTVDLGLVQVLVVDEADRMHDMGFIPQIRRIIAALPTDRQTLMFTATMPRDVEEVARRNMRSPVKILVGPPSRPVERAEQKLFHVQETEKISLLLSLLQGEPGRVLVFVRTKRGVDRLASRILRRHHGVARIHGDREQRQRDEAMGGFREGRYRILIATDIAARGLDIADIEHVINYDFPRSPEDYVHRIGRTARLAAVGRATSFVTPADRHYLADLERLLGSRVPVVPAPGGRSSAAEESPARQSTGRAAHPQRQHTGRTPVAASHAAPAPHPHEAGGTADAHGHGGRRGRRRGRGRGHGRGAAQTVAPTSSAPAPEAPVTAAAPHPHQTGMAPGSERSGRRRGRRRGRGHRGPGSAAPLSPVPATEAFEPAAPDAGVHHHSPHPRHEAELNPAQSDESPSAVTPTTVEWD